ncbi:MAG: hypothetical protein R3B47_13950 [Bacteroidia bacterium]
MRKICLILIAFAPLLACSQIGESHSLLIIHALQLRAKSPPWAATMYPSWTTSFICLAIPALANDSMHGHLAMSVSNYLGDLTLGYAGYSAPAIRW